MGKQKRNCIENLPYPAVSSSRQYAFDQLRGLEHVFEVDILLGGVYLFHAGADDGCFQAVAVKDIGITAATGLKGLHGSLQVQRRTLHPFYNRTIRIQMHGRVLS